MQIPVFNGTYTDSEANFRASYPVNLVPVPHTQGISSGYLRPADGIVEHGTGPGICRGGINWNGVCYRVMGTKLVSIDELGTVTTLGEVGGVGQVSMDYSFDRLAIASGGDLFYWNGTTLTQVTDPDLGNVVDFCWVDGYFMTTDGQYLIVTELNAPTLVNPLKYGSSEIDPDPIKAILKLRNEPHSINRYTIEAYSNAGGEFFPFSRIDGAHITKGSVGTHSCCIFMDTIAFVGGGRNESIAIYMAANAQAVKVSSHEIDLLLSDYTEAQLSDIVLETRTDKANNQLLIRLPDRTLVYDATASSLLNEPVWFTLTSSIRGFSAYRAIDIVRCYGKWLVGDTSSAKIGYMSDTVSSHYGDIVRWEFGTLIAYAGGRGAIIHDLELVCLTGRVAFGVDPQISTSYSEDGMTWSQDIFTRVGKQGDRTKRIVWFRLGLMRNWRIQRFRGDSQSFISVARLEANVEQLSV